MRRISTYILYLACACVCWLVMACQLDTVYNHYEHTPLSGWERNDTLTYHVGPILRDGQYREEIGLRISGDYPFTGLNLVVEQRVFPTGDMRRDTLSCIVVDQQGNAKGRGVSHYQYLFHLTTLSLHKDDRLYIAIRHDMKREILPGISDVGVKLSR